MENRFEQSPEEQGWKSSTPDAYGWKNPPPAPIVPPALSGQTGNIGQNAEQNTAHQTTRDQLCGWVCEKLSDMLDNDGSVRPEQAAGIYAHLAICRHCAGQWDEMQRVVSLVEKMPLADLPRDFSATIMQRIANPHAPPPHRALMPQMFNDAPGSSVVVDRNLASGADTAQSKLIITSTQPLARKTSLLHRLRGQQTQSELRSETKQTGVSTQSELLTRITAGSVCSSALAYLLSTTWMRQMLNVNVTTTGAWFGQCADVLRGVPLLTWVAGLIFSAFAQMNAMLGETVHVMSTAIMMGLALDVVICVAAYSFLTARRREAQLRF